MKTSKFKPGSLLIAPPNMADIRFSRSVILLVDHVDKDQYGGTIGICLNKPLNLCLKDIISTDNNKIPELSLYWGGPVNSQGIWMLHSSDWSCSQSWNISEEWTVSSSEEIIESILDGCPPAFYRLFLGHCGWGHRQLLDEIDTIDRDESLSWLIASEDIPANIFSDDGTLLWRTALDKAKTETVMSWL